MKARSCFFALALMLAPHAASAFDDLEIKNAQTRFDEGRALAAKGQYDEARLKFVQAYAVLQSPDSLYNLAYTEKRSLHIVEAIRHFRVLLRDPKTPADLREKAQGFIGDLAKTTAHVNVTAPNGADVAVDGTIVGRAPLADPVDVLSGQHTFTATLESKHASSDLRLDDGETTSITLEIPGVTSNGGDSHTSRTVEEHFRGSAGYAVPALLVGVGVVALGFGVGFAVDSSNKHDAAIAQQSACAVPTSAACDLARSLHDQQTTSAAVAVAMYVVGGVLAATGIVAFVVWPQSTRVRVVPAASAHELGATLQVSF